MAAPLLRTKLYVPRPRSELVPRPRLLERLTAGLGWRSDGFARKLTLVSAPAGFGKTTLLGECAAHCGRLAPKIRFAWLSLDERDNDPTTFLAYLIAALQTIETGLGKGAMGALQAPEPPPVEGILTTLINEIAQNPISPVLVLDDYCLIEAPPVHDALGFLLDHLPPQMHLVIASRADPPLFLSRLRGRGQLNELRTDDLRFTPDEAAAFLNEVMGLGLSVEDVDALEVRTEGWIVGLQMAAIALEGQRRRRGSHDLSGFIRAFTGSHRYVLDYLTDEVLLQQPETVRTFLLQTAILERLTGSLCDAVCVGDASTHENQGKDSAALIKSGQEMLEWLDAANLFIVPLDDERRWYRYHHLFGDLLRSRLEQAQPDWVPILHLRASKWYEANHLLPDAVHHAFATGDVERVANMLEGNALSLISYGRLQTSLDWIGALPPEVVRSRPWLCVAYAWALAYTGAFAESLVCLEGLESGGSALDGSGASTHLTGHIYAIRLHVSSLQLSVDEEAESYAQKALELLPEDDARTRSLVAVLLGRVQRSNHEYAAARETLSRTLAEVRSAGEGYAVVDLLCQLARVEAQQGNLNQAAATSQKALRMGEEYGGTHGRPLPVVSFAHATLAGCLREWNRLDDAERHAEAAIELGQMWEHADCLVDGYVSMLSIQLSSKDDPGALDTLQRIGQLDRRVRERYSLWLESWEVRVRLALGDVDFAAGWARDREMVFSDGIGWVNGVINLNLARIRIAQFSRGLIQTLDESLARLEAMYERFESVDWRKGAIEALILRAMAWNALGEVEQGLAALSRALSLAEPEGYVRIFLDEGEPMSELLRQVAARGTLVNYVGRLLSEWEREGDPKAPRREWPSLPDLVEPLSERELEVLRLLSVGLSNREIAEQLFLAVGTVKKYTSNIYGKLGIHSRIQAVARARELGLV